MRNSGGIEGPVPPIRLPFNYDVDLALNRKNEASVMLTLETVIGVVQIPMSSNTALDLGRWLEQTAKRLNRDAGKEPEEIAAPAPSSGLLLPDRDIVVP